MNRSIKRAALLLGVATTLVACGKAIWQSNFNVDGAYATYGHVGTLLSDGVSFLGGHTMLEIGGNHLRRGFIAKFDAKGKPEWHQVLDSGSSLVSIGVQGLLSDSEGNVYVTDTLWDEAEIRTLLSVSKLNSSGALLWSWQGETDTALSLKRDMRLGEDGNLYVKSGGSLHSLTAAGEFRFTENAQAAASNCMGWFHDGTYQHALEVVHHSNSLRIIDLNDNRSFDYAANCMGLSTIERTDIVNGDVYVFGRDASTQQLKAHVLRQSEHFRVSEGDIEGVLPVGSHFSQLSKYDGNGFCFASAEPGKLVTGFVDANLQVKWTNEHVVEGAPDKFNIGDVVTANNACYTQYVDTLADGKISSAVVVEDENTGITKAHLKKVDVVVMGIAVNGIHVLQSGYTGSYTTEVGMSAYLSKSVVK